MEDLTLIETYFKYGEYESVNEWCKIDKDIARDIIEKITNKDTKTI